MRNFFLFVIKIFLLANFALINSSGVVSFVNVTTDSTELCKLTGNLPIKAFPSLLRCYKYNKYSCCSSIHDDYIDGRIKALMTSNCIKLYEDLQDLFCFACNPSENYFRNSTLKQIYICDKLAETIWFGDINNSTSAFDKCGLKVPDYLSDLSSKNYIVPSLVFKNFTHFINRVKMPYFEDFEYVITNNTDICYMGLIDPLGQSAIKFNLLLLFVILFIF